MVLSTSLLSFTLASLLPNIRLVVQADTTPFFFPSAFDGTGLTSSCVTALTANVSCNAYVARFFPGYYLQQEGLEASCTSDCSSGLSEWQQSVTSACTGQSYAGDEGNSDVTQESATNLADLVLASFQLACLQEHGDYCNVWAYNQSLATANSTGDSSNSAIACDDCFLGQMQIEVNSPALGGFDVQQDFNSLTSSCGKTNFPVSTTWSSSVSLTSMPATPTCTGKTYQIQPDDDCNKISLSQNIGTAWLMTDNNLPAFCAGFPTSGNLCINNGCDVYTVQANDTCESIATSLGVTKTQLLSWNPVLGKTCAGLEKNVGYQICKSVPGTPYEGPVVTGPGKLPASTAVPVPSDIANGTTTNCAQYYCVQTGDYCNLLVLKFSISLDDFIFLNSAINSNCTNLFADESYCVAAVGDIDNYPGHSGYIPPPTAYSTIPWTSFPSATFVPDTQDLPTSLDHAPGTRSDCLLYVDGGNVYIDPDADNKCQAVADGWGLTSDQLANWNPSLNFSDPGCSFSPSYSYCFQTYQASDPPQPVFTGPATVYPRRDGTWTNCTYYFDVVGDESCQSILDEQNINIQQFSTWNPAVGSDCSNLWADYSYCINDGSVKPGDPSSTSTSTGDSTPAGPTPPAQTQSGQPSNCNRWYVAQTGDGCTSIETQEGVAESDFLAWNPAVGDKCANGVWLNYAYCVGIPGSPTLPASSPTPTPDASPQPPGPTQTNEASNCNKWYVVQQGDGCYSIEQSQGVSDADFINWNPAVGDQCQNGVWLNYAYCVGVSS